MADSPFSGVSYRRPELRNFLPMYALIRDCLEGQTAIKKQRQKYLPMPNSSNTSKENVSRYREYLARSVFYNFTRHTLNGLVGQVFSREPQVELPPELEIMTEDATGSGLNLKQFAKKCVQNTIAYGRCGIMADYPDTKGAVTRQQLIDGDVRPSLKFFSAEEIINWRTIVRSGKLLLGLVVVSDFFLVSDDGFEQNTQKQLRVLRLVNDSVYTVQLWRWELGGWIQKENYTPTDASGKTFDAIPFTFIGPDNNDANPDYPPLYDLSELNVAHFRNSADYEEAAFITGQPTTFVTGLTQEWYEKVLRGSIEFGSRAVIALPEGASAGILQIAANILPKEAMDQKERQAVALGAKLVEQKSVQRTAFEAGLENSAESSTLSSIADNVSEAIELALQWACAFVGADAEKVEFDLNTEFDLTQMSAEDRLQTIKEWQAGALAFTEMRANLRRAGIATLADEEAVAAINEELAAFSVDPTKFDGMAAAVTGPGAAPAAKTPIPAPAVSPVPAKPLVTEDA